MFRVPTLVMLHGTFDKSFSKLPLCWIHTCRRILFSLITNFNAVPIFLFCLFHLRNQGIIVLWIVYIIWYLRVIMLLSALQIDIKTSINYHQLKLENKKSLCISIISIISAYIKSIFDILGSQTPIQSLHIATRKTVTEQNISLP